MWDYLTNIPSEFSFIIIILTIAALVIISLRGHFKAKLGLRDIEIGPSSVERPQRTSSASVLNLPDTEIVFEKQNNIEYQKRSCGDCILLLMGEREKYEVRIRQESHKILKIQMNFAEQKLIEVQNYIMRTISNHIHNTTNKQDGIFVDENLQSKLIYGLLMDIIVAVKNECRRSFKDNGFYDVCSSDFSRYTQERVAVIYSIMNQYIHNMFPNRSDFISPNSVIDLLEKERTFFTQIIKEIYVNARTAKLDAHKKTNSIKDEFSSWVDHFIGNQDN